MNIFKLSSVLLILFIAVSCSSRKEAAMKIDELVKIYNLQPHPEGGYYSEYYRDEGMVPKSSLPERFKGDRNYSSNIWFLLPEGKKSHLHRIPSDETWHFYSGGPLTIVQISPQGKMKKILLGQDIKKGEKFAHVVPAGYWFGAYSNPESRFSFVGCTVAPAFDFADFEMGNREKLLKEFPDLKDIIIQLCP